MKSSFGMLYGSVVSQCHASKHADINGETAINAGVAGGAAGHWCGQRRSQDGLWQATQPPVLAWLTMQPGSTLRWWVMRLGRHAATGSADGAGMTDGAASITDIVGGAASMAHDKSAADGAGMADGAAEVVYSRRHSRRCWHG